MSGMAASAAATWSPVTVALAPGMTMMRLAPVTSTSMTAVPASPSMRAMWVSSMPSSSTTRSRNAPALSALTAPIIVTRAPSRAAATAWLRPLPPALRCSDVPNTVSPESGMRSRLTTRSWLRLPTTTTRSPMGSILSGVQVNP